MHGYKLATNGQKFNRNTLSLKENIANCFRGWATFLFALHQEIPRMHHQHLVYGTTPQLAWATKVRP